VSLAAGRSRVALRGLYLASFAVLGATVPFLAGELKSRGIDGWAFVFVLSALPLGRIVAAPPWGALADTRQAHRAGVRLGGLLAVIGAVGMLSSSSTLAMVAAAALFSMGAAPTGPLIDSLALGWLGADRSAYGSLRGWGSFGYLLGSFGVGWAVDLLLVSPLWATILTSAAVLGFGLLLPPSPPPAAVERPSPDAPPLPLTDPVLWTLLVASALHFSIHVATSSLLDVHLDAVGLASRWTGTAIAAGVVVEIAVMARSRALMTRFGPRALFLAAMALAVVRWTAMLFVRSPWAIVAVQALHGLTFGAFWVAAVALVDDWAGPSRRARGQATLSAAMAGVGALGGVAGGAALVEATDTFTLFKAGVAVSVLACAVGWLGPRRARGKVAS